MKEKEIHPTQGARTKELYWLILIIEMLSKWNGSV